MHTICAQLPSCWYFVIWKAKIFGHHSPEFEAVAPPFCPGRLFGMPIGRGKVTAFEARAAPGQS